MATKTNALPDELWDIDRLCAYLGSSKHLIYRLTSERRIRYYRAGKELRFDPVDIAAWLAAEAVEPTGPGDRATQRRGRPRLPR